MARSDSTNSDAGTATATAEAPATTPEDQAKAEAKKAQRKARRALRSYVVVPMPANMKAIFEEEAKNAQKAVGPHIRDLLASQKGIEIPVTVSTPRRKYANDDEREAAKKARRETRSTTMKGLMNTFQTLQKAGVSPEQATAIAGAVMASGRSVQDVAQELGINLNGAAAEPATASA